MSPAQRARQAARSQDAARRGDSYRSACRDTFDRLVAKTASEQKLPVYLDGKVSYLRALAEPHLRQRIDLQVHPNPKRGPKGSPRTPEAVARDAAMFPTDLLHGLLRHTEAHHRRETIAFGRRHNAVLERLFVFAIWRNWVKWRSERKPSRITPAMTVGLAKTRWKWERVLARRVFLWEGSLAEAGRRIYRREIPTRGLPVNARHTLTNAA